MRTIIDIAAEVPVTPDGTPGCSTATTACDWSVDLTREAPPGKNDCGPGVPTMNGVATTPEKVRPPRPVTKVKPMRTAAKS